MKSLRWVMLAVLVSAVGVLSLVNGCGGKESAAPAGQGAGQGASGGDAVSTSDIPSAARKVFSLDLSKDGPVSLLEARSISGAQVKAGVLELKTDDTDGNFSLFAKKTDGLKPPLWLKVEMSNSVPKASGQVYWSSGGELSEQNTAKWTVAGDGKMHTYVAQITADQPVIYVRFDPSDQKDTIKIKLLEVDSGS